jgi:D-glycero-D-manno-heptose 1,7-bisphosphate phosphatase
MPLPAIFLDRDGTINEEVHYLSDPAHLRLIPGAAAAIRRLRAAGYPVVVITNQSGIARGYFTMDTLSAIHARLRACLADEGTTIDGLYLCPHHPDDDCACRKPRSLLYRKAARELDLDLGRSVMVGDKETDLLAGKNLAMDSILVRTGFGAGHVAEVEQWLDYHPAYIAADLADAADWVLVHRTPPT